MKIKVCSLEVIEHVCDVETEDEAIKLFARSRQFDSVDAYATSRGLFAEELRDHLLVETVQ